MPASPPLLSAVGVKDGGELLRCATAPSVYLWQMEDDMVYLDGVDERFEAATGSAPSELIFVSRHASDSGKPTLTVHPIGEARPIVREPLEAFHPKPPSTESKIPHLGIPNSKRLTNHLPRSIYKTKPKSHPARNRRFKKTSGNPGNLDPKYGGKAGKCPPPSPRIAPLYRRLVSATAQSELASEFEVCTGNHLKT